MSKLTKKQRSEAAQKAWATMRKNEKKLTKAGRRALDKKRSEAAKKAHRTMGHNVAA